MSPDHTPALKTLVRKNRLRSIFALVLVSIVTPVFYFTIDLPTAIYARNELPRLLVQTYKKTDDFDDYIIIGLVLAALFAKFKQKNKARFQKFAFPPFSALFTGIITHILKPSFSRWRPKGYFKFEEYGFEFFEPVKSVMASFPSGHSSSIMALMTAVAILQPKYRVPCYLFAVLLATSRVVVGAHYPSDVIAGLSLGYVATHWLHYIFIRKSWLPGENQRML